MWQWTHIIFFNFLDICKIHLWHAGTCAPLSQNGFSTFPSPLKQHASPWSVYSRVPLNKLQLTFTLLADNIHKMIYRDVKQSHYWNIPQHITCSHIPSSIPGASFFFICLFCTSEISCLWCECWLPVYLNYVRLDTDFTSSMLGRSSTWTKSLESVVQVLLGW